MERNSGKKINVNAASVKPYGIYNLWYIVSMVKLSYYFVYLRVHNIYMIFFSWWTSKLNCLKEKNSLNGKEEAKVQHFLSSQCQRK